MGQKENNKYYLIKQKAVPEVLLKVIEAKRLLETEKVMTIQEAAEKVGLSRSSFYKYKDDIFPLHGVRSVKDNCTLFGKYSDDSSDHTD